MLTKADLTQIKEAMGIDKLMLLFTTAIEKANKTIMERFDALEKSVAGEYTKLNSKVITLESSHAELKDMVLSNRNLFNHELKDYSDTTKSRFTNNAEEIHKL